MCEHDDARQANHFFVTSFVTPATRQNRAVMACISCPLKNCLLDVLQHTKAADVPYMTYDNNVDIEREKQHVFSQVHSILPRAILLFT